MKGRVWILLALLALSGTGLAGCIEAFESLSSDEAGITALEDRDLADNAAAAWDPDAMLVGVASAETRDARLGVPLDNATGDGRAPFWYYAYADAASETLRLFRVTQDGQVTPEDEFPPLLEGLEFDAVALDPLALDSDRALEAVRATEAASHVFSGENLTVVQGAARMPEESATCWTVAAMSDAGFVVAMVDAETGEVQVLEVEQADLAAFAPEPMVLAALAPPVHIQDEGTLEREERTYEFDAGEGMGVRLELWARSELEHERLVFELVDEDGNTLLDGRLHRTGEEGKTFEADIEETGTYTLVVRHAGPFGWYGDDALLLGEVDFTLDLLAGHDLASTDAGGAP